ncbi:MAG: type II toxin-antitoxin system HicB family antitoxin [Candidatus Binatia bacterium]
MRDVRHADVADLPYAQLPAFFRKPRPRCGISSLPTRVGQGRTKEEARKSLSEAIALILEDRRADALRGVPTDAERGTVTVE